MAQRKSNKSASVQAIRGRVNWDCVVKDVLHQWWVILLCVVGVVCISVGIMQIRHRDQYTAKSTFVIGTSGFSSNEIYSNLNNAETITNQYSQVIRSSILRKQVCEELGIPSFNASVSVSTVKSTNLMVMNVTASTPREAFLISRSVIRQATDIMALYLNSVNIREIEESVIPTVPSNPLDLKKIGMTSGLAAFAAILLLLLFISYSKDTIRTVEDVSLKVDTRLLGTIPYEKKRKAKKGEYPSLLITNPMLSFAYVESYRMLATRVRLYLDKQNEKTKEKRQILLVTSVSENEGKSTVASNIAVSLAQEGKVVLLIDCDFRKPAQYKIFERKDVPEERDFCYILQHNSVVRITSIKEVPGLFALFSKTAKDTPLETASLKVLRRVLNQLKQKVDYIVIDSAPMAFVSDTEEYAAIADASLLVVRQDIMEACYINDAVDNLENTGTELLGCVFNGFQQGFIEKTRDYGNYSGGHAYSRASHYNKQHSREEEKSRE